MPEPCCPVPLGVATSLRFGARDDRCGRGVAPMITITDPKTVRLARELARRTGESVDDAVARALSERMAGLPAPRSGEEPEKAIAELEAIAAEIAALPDLDTRSPDEILGYDDHGAFKPW